MTGRASEKEDMASYVADDVGIAQFDAKGLRGIDAGVHAGEDEVLLGWGQRQVTLGEGG